MPKKRNIYFFVLGVLFVGYLIIQIFKPKEIDWSPDYTGVKKIPFGCYVLKDLLPVTKPGLNLHINYESLPAALDKIPQPSNLLIITESFNPDKAEVSAIIDYLNKGNKALISAINFGKFFVDTFQVATNMSIAALRYLHKPVQLNFMNPTLKSPTSYSFKGINPVYFSSFDRRNTTLISCDSLNNAVFIGIKTGKGTLYLTTKPEIFTNYHMLYSASDYAIKSIGYLDSKDLIWDEHYKPKPLFEENLSPMRYIFSQKPLKYGYFLLLFTFVIYMVFESKRRQRIIPTNYPPNNKTREFVETVGQLYLNRKDHIDLAKKKIQYFYDFINGTFYLQVDEGSQKFRKLFAEKAMISYEESENLFNEIIRIKNSDILKDADLVKFVKMLDRIQKIKN